MSALEESGLISNTESKDELVTSNSVQNFATRVAKSLCFLRDYVMVAANLIN
jgi:hypothetical protein